MRAEIAPRKKKKEISALQCHNVPNTLAKIMRVTREATLKSTEIFKKEISSKKTDRQTDRQSERQTDRQRDRQTFFSPISGQHL